MLSFKINTSEGKFYVNFWSHFHTIHMWSWIRAYTLIVLPKNLHTLILTNQMKDFSFTVVIWLTCVAIIILFRVLAFRPLGICQLFNASYKFLENFYEKFMFDYRPTKKDKNLNKFWEKILSLSFWSCSLVGFLGCLDFFIHPQAAPYPSFNIDDYYLSWPMYLVAGFWYCKTIVGVFTTVGFVLYSLLTYFLCNLPIIRNEMRLGRSSSSYKTCVDLRVDLKNLVTTWRALEINVILLNTEFTEGMFLYIQGSFTSCIVFCIVTLTYEWDTCGRVLQILLIVGASTVYFGFSSLLLLAGLEYKWSGQTIRSWKRQYFFGKKDWLYVKKFKRSCRPFSIGDGRRYVIRPQTVLRFLISVSKCTSRALIAYGRVFR